MILISHFFLKFAFLAIISGIWFHVYWPLIVLKIICLYPFNKGAINFLIDTEECLIQYTY